MTTVSKRELAERWSIHQSNIDKYLVEGMPFLTKGNKRDGLSTFDFEACNEWRNAKLGLQEGHEDETMQQARLRKLQAEASLAELELEQQKGTVVAIEDVAQEMANVFSTVKTRLLALSAKLPGLVIGMTTEREMQDVIDREIRTVLTELTSQYVADKADEEAAEDNDNTDQPNTVQDKTF